MTYDALIKTVSEILENDNIYKVGLTLTYELGEVEHLQMNEIVFRKSTPFSSNFVPSDEFEVMIGGILVKFKKKFQKHLTD